MSKKSKKARKQNTNKTLRSDIYNKLYICLPRDIPLCFWFSEDYKGNEKPGWQAVYDWIEPPENREPLPHKVHTFAAIMNITRDLVENIFHKIESGQESKDTIFTYYISTVLDIPPDKRGPINAQWSSFETHIGADVRKLLSTLSDLDRKNPFLSSVVATDIMCNITQQWQSALKGALGSTGETPTA